jgi:hypothetical protein
MNLRHLTILLIALALAFIFQGCLPPPPPPNPFSYNHDGHHDRLRSSLEQLAQSVAKLANPKGENFGYQREVIH